MKATKERIARTLLLMSMVVVAIGVDERSACAANPEGPSLAAARRLSQPGIEDKALAAETGAWNVVSTLQFTPDAAPIVSKDLIAERRMVGNYQQEIMRPAKGSGVSDFRRIAQYWTSADGTGRRWLAVQYEYARRH